MAKILFHSLTFSPDSVSTAYLLTDLAQSLHDLGHSVSVLTTTPHYNIDKSALDRQPLKKRWFGLLYESTIGGVHVWHIRFPMKGDRIFSRLLDYIYFHCFAVIAGYSIVGAYDIVIASSPPLTIGIIGWLLSRWRKAPFVYNIQELYADYAINQNYVTNPLMIRLLRWLEALIYSKSAKLVPISEWFSSIIQQRGIPEKRIRVISNFIDVKTCPIYQRDNSFAQHNILLNTFVVYYGGNIGLYQDWDSVLYAAEQLSNLPIQFIITGDGVRRKWLEGEIGKKRLHNIKVFGYQQKESLPQIYASSDVCTIPMIKKATIDVFPSKIYTIMAYEKCVIAQADKNSELWWLIKEAQSGWVVEPGDSAAYSQAIMEAYNERSALIDKGKKGRVFIHERYSRKSMTEKYDVLIRELTSSSIK